MVSIVLPLAPPSSPALRRGIRREGACAQALLGPLPPERQLPVASRYPVAYQRMIEIRQTEGAVVAKTQTRPWDPAEHLETEEDMGRLSERRSGRGRSELDNGDA